MKTGDWIALSGVALAIVLYLMQAAATRRRDIIAARAVLLGVKYGMVEGWGRWFFENEWVGDKLENRAREDYGRVKDGGYGQVFRVPSAPLVALLRTPTAGDLIERRTLEAANLALYWVGVFDQLVQEQTRFNELHLAEFLDDQLPDARREALARAAYSISHMLHASGVGRANAPGEWYRNLAEAVEENISALERRLELRWWRRLSELVDLRRARPAR